MTIQLSTLRQARPTVLRQSGMEPARASALVARWDDFVGKLRTLDGGRRIQACYRSEVERLQAMLTDPKKQTPQVRATAIGQSEGLIVRVLTLLALERNEQLPQGCRIIAEPEIHLSTAEQQNIIGPHFLIATVETNQRHIYVHALVMSLASTTPSRRAAVRRRLMDLGEHFRKGIEAKFPNEPGQHISRPWKVWMVLEPSDSSQGRWIYVPQDIRGDLTRQGIPKDFQYRSINRSLADIVGNAFNLVGPR